MADDEVSQRPLWWSQGGYSGWRVTKEMVETFDLREQEVNNFKTFFMKNPSLELKKAKYLPRFQPQVPHLQNISAAAMSAAGKAAFTVAGVLPSPSDGIALTFKDKNENEVTLKLPCADTDPAFQSLLEACQPAKFGHGTQRVFDEKIRKALAMPASALSECTFKVEDYKEEILDTIKNLMMPGSAGVTAKLDKINIYRPGDFFKAHEDTPVVGENFFGSLVVCLPVGEHTGGGLAVTANARNNEIITHFFGRSAGRGEIAWAAHYSEVRHEVEKVETGHRLTLTYQLLAQESAEKEDKPIKKGKKKETTNKSLEAALQNALQDPSFMPTGGKLGFPCTHRYAHTSRGASPSNIKSLLKGADSILVSTVAQMPGLTTTVARVWRLDDLSANKEDFEEECCDGARYPGSCVLESGSFTDTFWFPLWTGKIKPYFKLEQCYAEVVEDIVKDADPSAKPDMEIRWICGTPLTAGSFKHWDKSVKGGIFGNDACDDAFGYSTLAVLVQVPPYEERRQQYGGGSGGAGPSTA
jgi:hypothetical protein